MMENKGTMNIFRNTMWERICSYTFLHKHDYSTTITKQWVLLSVNLFQ